MSPEKKFIVDVVKEVLAHSSYMSVTECAKKLGLDRRTIRAQIKKKEIFATQTGNKILIPEIQFLR
tara:strand:+ start:360 stop:557 length:198 start_codon:yes stop_codon:yes gene_type:complete